jgi:NTE family protein
MDGDRAQATAGLFGILEGAALDRLDRQPVTRGTRIISEGSSADAMYLVETGRFRVERDGVHLAEIGAGSVIGEIAFLTGGQRTADVIAARNSVVLRIDRSAFDLLCDTTPGLQRAIAAELAARLAETSARVVPDPGRPRARTICLIPSAGAPMPARFAADLAAAMARAQPTRLIAEADFRAALGDAADPEGAEALAWLNAQERQADTILFVAGPRATAWSRSVLKQADHVIFVAQAHAPAPPSELETLALDLIPPDQRRLVLIHPHRMQRAPGTSHWLTSRPVFLHHHVALTPDGEDIARLARFLTGRAIGMVLSGGGAFGVAHVGVWRAIRDLGIPLDVVGGTSVGAAMAGAIALGVPAEEIGPRVESIFVRSGAMRRVTVPKYAFLDHKVLDEALLHHYGTGPIEDLWLPFYAVAADLSSMSLTEIRTGPLWEAVRASSAIPGILPPFFTSAGKMLVDGGCIDNMPFRTMHRLKTGPNIVVNVQKETGKVYHVDYARLPGRAELVKRSVLPFGKGAPRAPGLISTVMRSLLVGQSDMLRALLPSDMMIRPPGLSGAGFLAWSQHKLFYEMAYKHATEAFDKAREAGDPTMLALLDAARR